MLCHCVTCSVFYAECLQFSFSFLEHSMLMTTYFCQQTRLEFCLPLYLRHSPHRHSRGNVSVTSLSSPISNLSPVANKKHCIGCRERKAGRRPETALLDQASCCPHRLGSIFFSQYIISKLIKTNFCPTVI